MDDQNSHQVLETCKLCALLGFLRVSAACSRYTLKASDRLLTKIGAGILCKLIAICNKHLLPPSFVLCNGGSATKKKPCVSFLVICTG